MNKQIILFFCFSVSLFSPIDKDSAKSKLEYITKRLIDFSNFYSSEYPDLKKNLVFMDFSKWKLRDFYSGPCCDIFEIEIKYHDENGKIHKNIISLVETFKREVKQGPRFTYLEQTRMFFYWTCRTIKELTAGGSHENSTTLWKYLKRLSANCIETNIYPYKLNSFQESIDLLNSLLKKYEKNKESLGFSLKDLTAVYYLKKIENS